MEHLSFLVDQSFLSNLENFYLEVAVGNAVEG
jgi:hypothetical protein